MPFSSKARAWSHHSAPPLIPLALAYNELPLCFTLKPQVASCTRFWDLSKHQPASRVYETFCF